MRARAGVLALGLLLAACGGEGREPSPQGPPAPSGAPQGEDTAPSGEFPKVEVTVYFPSAGGEGLVGETRTIFDTGTAVDRAKQIVSELIAGPQGEGALRALPEGTVLRQLYIHEEVAYADFGRELKDNLGGGSARELAAVYSVVDSLALNVPEIKRVGVLVEGRPVDSLNGHLDLTRPLPPDRTLIAGRGET